MSKELKKTLQEIYCGMLCFDMILAILIYLLANPLHFALIPAEIGVLIGTCMNFIILRDMAIATEDAIESKDSEYARKKVTKHSILRMFIIVLVIVVFAQLDFINILTLVFSIFGIKVGAYLQPFVHKVLQRGERKV